MVDDVDAFVPRVLEVDLNPNWELPPTAPGQVEWGLTERMEHKHMCMHTHTNTAFSISLRLFQHLKDTEWP